MYYASHEYFLPTDATRLMIETLSARIHVEPIAIFAARTDTDDFDYATWDLNNVIVRRHTWGDDRQKVAK